MSQVSKQKYVRSSLSDGQVTLLKLVYKYRFVSRQLVAESLEIKPSPSLYRRLEVLVNKKLLGKRFDTKLKLHGIPAAYYLTPQGMHTLRHLDEDMGITEATIKAAYSDKRVGQGFINHTLDIYEATNLLAEQYRGLKVFTKRQLTQYAHFPPQLPDAFLSLPNEEAEEPKRFFLDVVADNTPRSTIDYRLGSYCSFFDNDDWDETGSELPTLLFIARSLSGEKRLRRLIKLQLYKNDMENDLTVLTTNLNAVRTISDQSFAVWADIEDTEELLRLDS